MKVFVTDADTSFAQALLPALCRSEAVEAVTGGSKQPLPFEDPKKIFHVHQILLTMHGIHILENVNAEEAVKDGVHDHLIDALRYWFVNRCGTEVRTRLY